MTDLSLRYAKLSEYGDPLERLNKLMDWKIFLPLINRAFEREKKSAAGRKPFNRLMMFKVLVLQQLYNLSDPQTEYQIRDRLSFIRFLHLNLTDAVPDEKTIWAFREVLVKGRVIEKLFERFDNYLKKQGLNAACGHMIDATIVPVPKQRNSREDNQKIKMGAIPDFIANNVYRKRQKDLDARWTVKGGQHYYGYKSHVNADVKYKIIRRYEVTSASTADNSMLLSVLHHDNTDNKIWADSAYHSEVMETELVSRGFISRLIRRYGCHQESFSLIQREMSRRAKIRKRVEHIFGFMENSMGGKLLRTIGLVRARCKIGLMNLVYNICRYEQIMRLGVA